MNSYKKPSDDLCTQFLSMDGRDEKSYCHITGSYDYGDFILTVEHVPENPGLRPARLRVMMPLAHAKFPRDVFTPRSREIAARSFIARRFAERSEYNTIKMPGIRGGSIFLERPGRELLETSAVVIGDTYLEVRFTVLFPVQRRKVHAQSAVELFQKKVPATIRESLVFDNIDGEKLADWIETNEDADALRTMLADRGLVAFIADGSILNTGASTVSDRPVRFTSPDELAVTVELPNRGSVRGMGIPRGITLVTGGYSQGKTTLLRAVELGVYNHRFGDGRELAVTVPDAVGIRVDEGRRVVDVDLSPLIKSRKGTVDYQRFSSESAGPVESFAANLMEALEIGTSLLLFDDETTVSSFIDRDARIQKLLPHEEEPLIRIIDLLPVLRDRHGVSSVVVGGSGDFFDIADTVLTLKKFRVHAVTAEARRIAENQPSGRIPEVPETFVLPSQRRPLSFSLEPIKDETGSRTIMRGAGYVQYGDEFIDLTRVTQLVSISQGRAIARGISMVHRLMDGSTSLNDAVKKVIKRVETIGLDALSNRYMGDLASFRAYELAAAINRMARLKIK